MKHHQGQGLRRLAAVVALAVAAMGLAACVPLPPPDPGVPPDLSIYPSGGPAGNDTPGSPGDLLTVEVYNQSYNSGTGPLAISLQKLSGVGQFVVVDDGCSGTRLPSPGECEVIVQYENNTGSGTYSGTFTANDFTSSESATVGVTGYGVPGGLEIRRVGYTGGLGEPLGPGEAVNFTVRNTSAFTTTSVVPSLDTSGSAGDGTFTFVSSGSDDCIGQVLTPGDSCTLRIQYDTTAGPLPNGQLDTAWLSVDAPPAAPDPFIAYGITGNGV